MSFLFLNVIAILLFAKLHCDATKHVRCTYTEEYVYVSAWIIPNDDWITVSTTYNATYKCPINGKQFVVTQDQYLDAPKNLTQQRNFRIVTGGCDQSWVHVSYFAQLHTKNMTFKLPLGTAECYMDAWDIPEACIQGFIK